MSERERFFVNHGMIHDGLTGKHVELDEAAELLNVEPADIQRIAWGIVTKLGAMLKNMEAERDAAKAECEQLRVARAAAGQRVLELEGLLNTRAVATVGVLDVARGEHERLTAERDAARAECERLRAGNVVVLCLECATECRMDDEGGCTACGCPALLVEGGKITIGADAWTDVRDGFESATAECERLTKERDEAVKELDALLEAMMLGPLKGKTAHDEIVSLRTRVAELERERDAARKAWDEWIALDPAALRESERATAERIAAWISSSHQSAWHSDVIARNIRRGDWKVQP